MSAWERYLHEDAPDRLVQLAILHAEFEALHPFLDGNGRLGRMLAPLFLWQKGLISRPMFYISAWLEAHRDEYYDRLLAVSRDDDWTGWCGFFLEAVRTQAEENLRLTQAILHLYDELKLRLPAMTRSDAPFTPWSGSFSVPSSKHQTSSKALAFQNRPQGDSSVSSKKTALSKTCVKQVDAERRY